MGFYDGLPIDISGSRTKNRFNLEILWGLKKIYELYSSGKEFTVIFDHLCDIDVLFEDKSEFYQVKTRKHGSSIFSLHEISKQKNGRSILGQLYIILDSVLKKHPNKSCNVFLVANTPFKPVSKKNTPLYCENGGELKALSFLSDDCKKTIIKHFKEEFESDYDETLYEHIFLMYEEIPINSMDNLVKGVTATFCDKNGYETTNVNLLYRSFLQEIREKAAYEFSSTDDKSDSIIKEKKGITRQQVTEVLTHAQQEQIEIKVYEKFENPIIQEEIKEALSNIFPKIKKSSRLQDLETRLQEHIRKNKNILKNTGCFESMVEFLFADEMVIDMLQAETIHEEYEQKAFIALNIEKRK